MPHPNTHPDADAIYARISLSLAKSQRLFSSLPPNTNPTHNPNNPTPHNPPLDPDPDPSPDLPGLLGIGATPPSPTTVAADKTSPASDEVLRRQLLGKDWVRRAEKKGYKGQGNGGRATVDPKAGKGAGRAMKVGGRKGSEGEGEEEEEDEAGRSSLGSVKMKGKRAGAGVVRGRDTGDEEGAERESTTDPHTKPPKRPANYLDEILADRATRRKKKKKKKGDKNGSNTH